MVHLINHKLHQKPVQPNWQFLVLMSAYANFYSSIYELVNDLLKQSKIEFRKR